MAALLGIAFAAVSPHTTAEQAAGKPSVAVLAERIRALRLEVASSTGDLREALATRSEEFQRLSDEVVAYAAKERFDSSAWLLAKGLMRLSDHDRNWEATLIAALKRSPNSHVREEAGRREAFANRMRAIPAELILETFDGHRLSLANLRGKVVLVNLWNFNCSACRQAMPKLQAVYERYRDRGFEIFGVCAVSSSDERKRSRELLKRKGVTWSSGVVDVRDLERRGCLLSA